MSSLIEICVTLHKITTPNKHNTMAKDKAKTMPAKTIKPLSGDRNLQILFMILLAAAAIGLYAVTTRNFYNLDDYLVSKDNSDIQQGIKAIPRIFTTLYSNVEDRSYGYRPLVRTSFAIEYQFFGRNPYASHAVNTLLYAIVGLMLFRVLKRLFKEYHAYFPFLATLLFLAHPVHTEVVASLKNRDELLMLLLCLVSLDQLITYVEKDKVRYLAWGIFWFFLSFFAKSTSTAFYLTIPLALYFFTGADRKKIFRVSGIIGGFAILAALGPFLYLPLTDRPFEFFENPLMAGGTIADRIAYGAFSLYFYLRLLIFPHPLRYYYGYNMFPDIHFGNFWVIASIVVHLGLLVYAIVKFKEKHILSFAILSYFGAIAMFLNTVRPVPGIIAERFLWVPSIGFAIALAWLFFKAFLTSPLRKKIPQGRLAGIIGLTVLLMIPYSAKTYVRNLDWRTEYTLFKADMPHLYNSYKANDQYANEIMQAMNKELSKPVSVVKFIDPQIREALMHWERAIEIYPDHYSPYNNIGIVYTRVYKQYDTALTYFDKALERKPDDPMVLFNMGMAYEGKTEYARAIDSYQKSLSNDPEAINTRSRLANVYYGLGEFEKAYNLNLEIMKLAPGEALPYVNLGNYYIFQRDTLNGIRYYEKAVELGAPPEASLFLTRYYTTKGDIRKAGYYKKIAEDQQKKESGR